MIINIIAFFLFFFPRMRENVTTLNLGCLFVIFGVYIEKGLGLDFRRQSKDGIP